MCGRKRERKKRIPLLVTEESPEIYYDWKGSEHMAPLNQLGHRKQTITGWFRPVSFPPPWDRVLGKPHPDHKPREQRIQEENQACCQKNRKGHCGDKNNVHFHSGVERRYHRRNHITHHINVLKEERKWSFVQYGGSRSVVSNSCGSMVPLPGSSVHGILQARILKWVAISFSRDLPNPGIESGLLYFRQILYWLELQGKPFVKYISF